MLHTVSSAVPGKRDSQPGQSRFYIFTQFKLGVWLFFLIEGVAGWTEVYQGPGSLKSIRTSNFRAQCYSIPASGVPICLSDMAAAARKECGQWRGVLGRLVQIWCRCVDWFASYITCDRTFGWPSYQILETSHSKHNCMS